MPQTNVCPPPVVLVPMDEYLSPDSVLSLPTDLLPASDALGDLLSACGVPEAEAAWDGAAPAYDRFAALLSALPLMPGHPLPARLTALCRASGCSMPLDAEHAPDVWAALAGIMGPDAEEPLTVARLAARMGEPLMDVLRPDLAVAARLEADAPGALGRALSEVLAGSDAPVLFRLPDGYAFTRPNPYRAGLLTKKALSAGRFSWDALTDDERDHLLSQLIRMTGESCLRAGRRMILAGRAGQLEPLVSYLSDAGCLPAILRLLAHPEDGDAPLSACPGAADGLWLEGTDTPLSIRRSLTAYAERMPVLRAEGVLVSLRTPTDAAAPAAVRAALAECLRAWGAEV